VLHSDLFRKENESNFPVNPTLMNKTPEAITRRHPNDIVAFEVLPFVRPHHAPLLRAASAQMLTSVAEAERTIDERPAVHQETSSAPRETWERHVVNSRRNGVRID
jgi:hypothetical protein